ncbi:hypothetical protein [Flavobacterium sp. LM4]|uniref:hypothetical protein n=1 Tax=Flavobacterium sp. LM4 TaxID=1938609 RepID=UPI000993E14F|nr:hypothetical protein [Flavobacterium sp. LM4]OOV20310.1 hypothetical protein BXU10_12075 [Flavobacterium sp. LM4]
MNINFFILLFLLATSACKITAQCNCKSKSFNGYQIKICNPLLVAFDSNYQIALSITQVADTKFLILTARFAKNAKTIGSDLMVFTTAEKVLILNLLDSEKDYVGGSEICNAKFELTDENINELSKYEITSLRFNFSDEIIKRTFGLQKNKTVIVQQINCLK